MKMKLYKILLLSVLWVVLLTVLSACGKEQAVVMTNEQIFSLEGIEETTISYDDEEIYFFASGNENLIIREYMSKDKKSYYARVSQKKDRIQISEGGKPFFKKGFIRYVEVYLPDSYSESLQVTVTDGKIDMSELELNLKSLRVDCTSGTLELKKAAAEEIYISSTSGTLTLGTLIGDQIRLDTTQGDLSCEQVSGNVAYTSTSGNAEFMSASGSGIYKADNSGKLIVNYEEVTGDLSFFNKNDDIEVSLPSTLEFVFEAVTKNGSVNTDFQGEISSDGDLISGTVGSSPEVTVRTETKNGNIEVSR